MFSLTAQFVPWNSGDIWKQSLGFDVMRIGTCVSVTQKNALFKLMKESQMVSDSFESMTVKIRFIHYKPMKAEQTYF